MTDRLFVCKWCGKFFPMPVELHVEGSTCSLECERMKKDYHPASDVVAPPAVRVILAENLPVGTEINVSDQTYNYTVLPMDSDLIDFSKFPFDHFPDFAAKHIKIRGGTLGYHCERDCKFVLDRETYLKHASDMGLQGWVVNMGSGGPACEEHSEPDLSEGLPPLEEWDQ